MPGFSFICDFTEDLKNKETQLTQSLRSLVHSELYTSRVIYHENSYFLGISAYHEYPVTALQNDRYIINVEGKIYGKDTSSLNRELQELADNIFHKGENYRGSLSDWLLTVDGDFIIIILDTNSGRILIFNDILGRLPLYYYRTSTGIIVTREIRFITNFIKNSRFNQMAIAQYLLFGFPLASRTLFEGVHRLLPANMIAIDIQESKIEIKDTHTFNFDTKSHKDRPFKENVDNLYELFLDAIRNRNNPAAKNIVSLSGGLDSRSVAAALHQLNIPFSQATYLDFDKTASHDARIAEQLANLFGVDWVLFHLDSPTREDALELLKIKNGMNLLGMSYILAYFKKIMEHYGNNIQFCTGDGGILLKDHHPDTRISDLGELTSFILDKHQIFSIDEVASLTNLSPDQIMSELENRFNSYPETEWQNKYMHFLHFDRCFKFQFEGEDRNRFYFWSVAPYYATAFFTYATNCPDSIKKRYKLYREFLSRLSPEAMAIENANWQFPITSRGGLFLYETIYPKLPVKFKGLIRKALKKHGWTSPVAENRRAYLEEQINMCNSIKQYLSISALSNLESMNKYKFEILSTIVSAIADLECNRC